MTKQAVLKLSQIADVLLICSGAGVLADPDFQRMYGACKQASVRKILGLSGPTEMTSVQRKAAAEIAKDRGIFTVTITNERLTRGIVTAVSWLGMNIKAYSWDELRTGIRQLGLTPDLEELVYEEALAMKGQVNW